MPSLGSSLPVLGLFSIIAIAIPHPPRSTVTLTVPTLPGLPSVPTGLKLKYIALGMGVQNYSCPATAIATSTSASATTTATATPLAIGAIATLYDATQLFTDTACLGPSALAALDVGLTCVADGLDNFMSLPLLGHHYFDSLARPTFDLSAAEVFLSAKKIAGVPAPSGTSGMNQSCAGRNGAAAVDWLFLQDCGNGLSEGVSAVYRVGTTGGKAVGGCVGKAGQTIQSDYGALYWFYG
jgi:hypothetical protein